MRELGIESVMINSNPETVSTDYDTSDLLFFEPLTHEDVLNVCERVNGGPFQPANPLKDFGSLSTPSSLRTQINHARMIEGQERAAIFCIENNKEKTSAVVAFKETGEISLWSHLHETGQISSNSLEAQHAIEIVGAGTWQLAIDWLHRKSTNLVQGVIVQFGGQTPLNLARGLMEAGVPILGTTVDSASTKPAIVKNSAHFSKNWDLKQPANGIARSIARSERNRQSSRLSGPRAAKLSCWAGGRWKSSRMNRQLDYYMSHAVDASTIVKRADIWSTNSWTTRPKWMSIASPILRATMKSERWAMNVRHLPIHRSTLHRSSFSPQAMIIGVMEHIEEAGIHSGDSACALPPFSLKQRNHRRVKTPDQRTRQGVCAVRGLMNVQYAIKKNEIYVIEVNPRASRTVPFVSKAQGQPFAKIAAKVMVGKSLAELGIVEPTPPKHVSVKEVVFPVYQVPRRGCHPRPRDAGPPAK